MKIYDCFCYFNEDMLLELRLETLWNVVDYFLISEATYSHAGKDRELHFDIKKFEKYRSKIRYLKLSKRPEKDGFWENEKFIRNNLSHGLYDAQPEDLILISDLDEIPMPEAIFEYNPKYLRGDFSQKYYSYYLNNLWIGDIHNNVLMQGRNIWLGSKITTYNHFVNFFKSDATSVRSYKSVGIFRLIKREWFKRFHIQIIENGGWHFTWVLSLADIVQKIESTAHQEFNDFQRKSLSHIISTISAGRDINKPNARYVKVDLDESFPSYLLNNLEKYKTYLL